MRMVASITLMQLWSQRAMGTDNAKYDTTGDGTVDFLDLFFVLENRDDDAAGCADKCRAAADACAERPYPRTDRAADRDRRIGHRQCCGRWDISSNFSPREPVPEQTQLLANYPNPFNPETWIPYQLAKDADVTLRIYAVDGQLVRTLALGHQPAGIYQSRHRAAYWDGRNAFGEPVASGVYFYTLTVGEFTATRKMLIRK